MTHEGNEASKREFLLYWAGFLTLVLGGVAILMTISELLVDILSYRCWYPILSPLLGVNEPPKTTQIPSTLYYCVNPAVAVVRFTFNLLIGLVIVGAGTYMMLNGKKR